MYAFQHGIQGNEGPSAADPSAAMNQEGDSTRLVVNTLCLTDERDKRGGKLGDTVIRPGSEVELGDLEWLRASLMVLWVMVISNTPTNTHFRGWTS